MTQVRLYGHQLGFTSFSQVTRGFALALADVGLFGGFVPLDFFDDDTEYPGSSCPVSINTGMPSGVLRAKALGNHSQRWLMLAPNSDRIPERMIEWMPEFCTALLSPSRWGVSVLGELFGNELPVRLVPHGVHREYVVSEDSRRRLRAEHDDKGVLRVLHMTSTNGERKGTKLLLDAWRRFTAHPGQDNRLTVVCRREGLAELQAAAAHLRGVTVKPSDGVDYRSVQTLYDAHHVVCQPSRAEGFGLIPLEAKVCGLPVVMTDCTGHADHSAEGATVVVETGRDEPIDDMDRALAPSLRSEAIYGALCEARMQYRALDERARDAAPAIRQRWSWENTTGRALKELVDDRENL